MGRQKNYQDPAPGNLADPENTPLGLTENNRQAKDALAKSEEMNQFIYTDFPKFKTHRNIMRMGDKRRLDRFFQAWDASAGNETIALHCAAYTRAEFHQMRDNDKEFQARLDEVNHRIADRAKFVLDQRIGIVKVTGEPLPKVSEYLLGQALKGINKQLYGGDSKESRDVYIDVPRPEKDKP